jgi:RNA polymerase sigma-70 factor (ECF subfamily)
MTSAPVKGGGLPAPAPVNREQVDAQTIEACRRGDRAALERVLRLHAPAVERTLSRLCGPAAELPDLLQETLTIACRSFKNFRGGSLVQTWLIGIAVQVSRAHFRKPHRRRQVPLYAVNAPEPVDPKSATDAQIDGRLLLHRVYTHLDALGEKKRQAFLLHVADGRSIGEISEILGVNPLTVKSRIQFARRGLLQRARRDPALREFLERLAEEPQ